jgi:dipeptidyl aminopeptidase/acylaminoacyl peptidase
LHGRLEILRSGRATLVSSATGIAELSWSSDGQWLAFERPYANASSVWVVRVNGSEIHKVASGTVVSFRWSTTGDVLAFATSNGGAHSPSTVQAVLVPSGRRVLEHFGEGEVESIVASGRGVAFGDSFFVAGVGFVQGSLLEELENGAKDWVVARSSVSSYLPLGFSPDGKTLLYAVDPMSSASIAADGLRVVNIR